MWSEIPATAPEQPTQSNELPADIKSQIDRAFDDGEINKAELQGVLHQMVQEKVIGNPENFNALLDKLYIERDKLIQQRGDDIFRESNGVDGEQWESRAEAVKEFTDFITRLTLQHAEATHDTQLASEVLTAHNALDSSMDAVHGTMLATKDRLEATLHPADSMTA